jgi:tetratricopeptide (TPR) repeat protein
MALVGDLASVDLAQVFQVLTQNQKDGVLELYRGARPHGVRFRRGAVTLQFDRDDYEERIVELFRRLGRISEEQLHLAVANRAGSNSALIDALVEMNVLQSEEVVVLLRERMAEELYDLFSWNEGRFEFHEGLERIEGAAGEIDDRLYFPADGLVMEAARRIDEWTQIRGRVPDSSFIYFPTVEKFVPEDDLQAAVFVQVDGTLSVDDIVHRVGRSQFEICKTLARLIDLGVVAPVPEEEFIERGRLAREAGRPKEAAHLYDLASNLQIGWPDSLARAAECWEEAGELATASARYVSLGDALSEAGDPRTALANFCRARRLVPTHIDAWKKAVLLSLHFEEIGETCEPAPAPLTLAEILIDIGQHELGVEVLERFVNCHPRDLDAKRALAQALENSGNRKRQIELLESVATDLLAQGDTMGAAASLQTALRLAPERRDISARIRDLYKKDERRRTGLKLLTAVTVILAITGALGFYAYSRNEKATAELAAMDIDGVVRLGEFARARQMLEKFKQDYTLTLALGDADLLLARVADAERASRDKERMRRAEELAVRNKRMAEASALAKGANAKVNQGNLGEALADLRRALATAPPDWDQAATARQNVADLDRYLTRAAELGANYLDEVKRGNFTKAREIATTLSGEFVHSPEGKNIKFPVEFTTDPPGSSIAIDNVAATAPDGQPARTPVTLLVEPARGGRVIQFTKPGFTPGQVTIDPVRDGKVGARLGRSAEETIALPGTPTAPPIIYNSNVYIPLAGARLACYSPDGKSNWIVSVASAGEIQFSPHADRHGVLVITSDGVVTHLAHEAGQMLWHRSYGAEIRVPPAMSNNNFLLATDDGRVRFVQRETGNVTREWKTAGRQIVAIAAAAPTMAAGLLDGRIQIFDMDSQRTDEKFLNFGAPVSGMLIVDDVLVAAGDDGRITGYEWTTGRILWDAPGGRIASPRPVLMGERIVVDRGGRITAIDPHTGAILATASETLEPTGTPARAGDQVIVSLRNGTVASLKLSDLSVLWQWPGAAGGMLNAAADKTRPVAPRLIAKVAASDTTTIAVADGKLFKFRENE